MKKNCAQKHTYFLEPRAREIIEKLPSIKTVGVLRNLLGVLTLLNIPEDHSGHLFDICYSIVESPKATIASIAAPLAEPSTLSGRATGVPNISAGFSRVGKPTVLSFSIKQ